MRALPGLLLVCSLAFPQTPVVRLGRVEGRLVDSATGEGIRKGWLTLRPAGANGSGYTTLSDSSGNFVFERVEPAKYSISAEHAAYLRFTAPSKQITVTPGDTVQAGRIELKAQGVLSGRVTDEDGDPFPNGVQVQVSRWQWDPQTGQRTLTQIKQTGADDQGNFRLAGLAPGLYYLSAFGSRTTAAFDDRTTIGGSEAYVTTFYPGSSGPAGATPVELTAGGEIRGLSLRLRKSRVSRIRGTARDVSTGEAVNQVALQLIPLGGYAIRPLTNDAVAVVQNGAFEFPRVQPGAYTILSADTAGAGRPMGRYDLTVAEGDLDVLLQLGPGATLEGKFRMEASEPLPEGLQFGLRSADGTRLAPFSKPDSKDATPRVSGILAGRYWIDVRGNLNRPSPNAYVKSIHLGDLDVTNRMIDIASGALPALDVLISANGGSVTGVVRNQKGDAAQASQVVLAPAARELGDVLRLVKLSAAGSDGAFRFAGVAPGDYLLFALDDFDQGPMRDPAFRAAIASKGVKVTVTEGAKLTVDVPLIPASVAAVELAKLQ
jgi:hypothetical protein